jgi:hypothetical protein
MKLVNGVSYIYIYIYHYGRFSPNKFSTNWENFMKPDINTISIPEAFLLFYLMTLKLPTWSPCIYCDRRQIKHLMSLAPQPSLGLGILHKIRLNFLEASQQFSFYRVGLLAPRQTPIPEDQVSVFISPRGRVATHFSRLLRHAWFTVDYSYPPVPTRGKLNIFL